MSDYRDGAYERDTDNASILAVIAELAEVFDKKLSTAALAAYAEDLQGIPLPLLRKVQIDLRRTCDHWPRVATWIERAKTMKESPLGLPPHRELGNDEPWCRDCGDTGFELGLKCPGNGHCNIPACRNASQHYTRDGWQPHTYTRLCRCRATNPGYRHANKMNSMED